MNWNCLLNRKPEYECAEFIHRCLNDGMTALALKPIAIIGSPKDILSGIVLLSSVNLLAISVETFLHISAPKPVYKPKTTKSTAESADAPVANPPATPAPIISFLIIDLQNWQKRLPQLPLTTGAPMVLD